MERLIRRGRESIKVHDSHGAAMEFAEKQIAAKQKKGYTEKLMSCKGNVLSPKSITLTWQVIVNYYRMRMRTRNFCLILRSNSWIGP